MRNRKRKVKIGIEKGGIVLFERQNIESNSSKKGDSNI